MEKIPEEGFQIVGLDFVGIQQDPNLSLGSLIKP